MTRFLGRRKAEIRAAQERPVEAPHFLTNGSEPPSDLAVSRPQLVMLVVGAVALAAVIVIALHVGELSAFVQLVARAKAWWIAAAILAQICAFLSQAMVWRIVLRHSVGRGGTLASLLPLTLGKLFADQALPSAGVSGAFFLMHALMRRDVTREDAFTAFVFGASSFIAAFAVAILASFILLTVSADSGPLLIIELATSYLLIFLVLASLVVAGVFRFAVVREWLSRLPFLKRLLEMTISAAKAVLTRRALFFRCVMLQLLARTFDAITLWLTFLAISEFAPFSTSFAGVSMASLAATIAPTPMGIGSFEGGLVGALAALGLGVEAALAATLLYRGLSLWLPLTLGFFVVQRELMRPRSTQ